VPEGTIKRRLEIMLILDCEIKNLLLKGKKDVRKDGFVYAKDWNDFQGMGISVVGTYSYKSDEYEAFLETRLSDLQRTIDSYDLIVGFNILNFDRKLLEAFGVQIPRDKIYDIYLEIKRAADAGKYEKGFNLKNIALVNNVSQKSGHGADAPEMWQQGKETEVIEYCLQDVKVTKELLDLIMEGKLRDPRNPEKILNVEKPFLEDDYDDSESTFEVVGDDDENGNS
jgi:DNA polymerase elongation subunit (family B)